jgi:3-deoxy-D-manno-octulosonic-acid transferase
MTREPIREHGPGERLALGLYTAGLSLARPALRLVRRYSRDTAMRRQRAGDFTPPASYATARPRLWLHGSSVGEINALPPIIAELRDALPGCGVVVSAFTDTGFDAASRLWGSDSTFVLPLDLPGPLARLLDAVAPTALLIAETEIWPGLLAAAAVRRVPVLVVNGRLTPRSVARYRLLRPLFARGLARLAGVAAQGQADAERFIALGVPADVIRVVGSSKFDVEPLAGTAAPSPPEPLAGRPVLVAGSTRDGDEEILLDALRLLAGTGTGGGGGTGDGACVRPFTILAPRHLSRLPDIEREVAARGLRAVRRSASSGTLADAAAAAATGPGGETNGGADLLLLDTLGELAESYRLAFVAVVGGGFRTSGSHNLLEPALRGRVVLFGPEQRSSAGEVELLIESGGGLRCRDAAELARALEPLLADPAVAQAAGERARAAVVGARGASRRVVAFAIERLGLAAVRGAAR